VLQAMLPQFEVGIRRVSIETDRMGARIGKESRNGELLPAGTAPQFMLPLKDGRLQTCILKIASGYGTMVPTANYHCIIANIGHWQTSASD